MILVNTLGEAEGAREFPKAALRDLIFPFVTMLLLFLGNLFLGQLFGNVLTTLDRALGGGSFNESR